MAMAFKTSFDKVGLKGIYEMLLGITTEKHL